MDVRVRVKWVEEEGTEPETTVRDLHSIVGPVPERGRSYRSHQLNQLEIKRAETCIAWIAIATMIPSVKLHEVRY